MPALVAQSTDLARRTVADQVFLDQDADGRFGDGDVWLKRPADAQGWYIDENGNSLVDPSETRVEADDSRITQQRSLTSQLVSWFDRRQIWIESMLGGTLDERAASVAEWHRSYTLSGFPESCSQQSHKDNPWVTFHGLVV